MPCNTIQTSTVDIGKLDPVLANAALAKLGVDGTYSNGKLITRGSVDVAEFKQAYSAQVVTSQAKKFGWNLKEVAPNKFEVMKR